MTDTAEGGTRKQVRGSSLLLAGRLLAKVVNFGVHVMIVRYLSRGDYGAFAYALSVVRLGQGVADLGLHRAISRYVPIFHEQREYGKAAGTAVMALSVTASLGVAVVLAVYCLQGVIGGYLIADARAVELLLILVLLSPVEALDRLLVGLFAVLASPRAIFFRRYVLAPGLRLTVVLLLILGGSNVRFLAAGYLAAGAIGVVYCGIVLWRMLHRKGELQQLREHTLQVPWREVFAFTAPLLTTDVTYLLMHTLNTMMLGYWGGTEDVAIYRAVEPMAKLNQIVFASFGVLFTPQAARLFARNDQRGLNHLYWQSAAWIAAMTFPVFVLTFGLAGRLTVAAYGSGYAESVPILMLLSLGYYVHAALGFNGTTLTIYHRLRYVVGLNLLSAVGSVIACLLLVPRYGALGAAMATCGSLILHNLLKQAGLVMGTGVKVFDRRYLRVYVFIVCGAGLVLLEQWTTRAPIYVDCGLAAVVSLLLIRLNREVLDVSETFPRLMRLPLVPLLLGKN